MMSLVMSPVAALSVTHTSLQPEGWIPRQACIITVLECIILQSADSSRPIQLDIMME